MSMVPERRSSDVDHLLRNAQLRDELEPYMDESILALDTSALPLAEENAFLESMLAWERAPALPISRWFEPELVLPPPGELGEAALRQELYSAIERLFHKRIVLAHTDHLSDRQLYHVIYRDILPAYEKMFECDRRFLRWDCVDPVTEPETWLAYYASDDEREAWAESTGQLPPEKLDPRFPRVLPGQGE